MGGFAAVMFGILTACLYMCIFAQNETYSEEVHTSETNASCANNVTNNTDFVCELDTTDVTQSTEVITVTDDANGITEIVNVENALSTEIAEFSNVTVSELPVNTTTEKSEIQTTQQPEATTEPIPATSEMAVEARAISNEICTCDLNVGVGSVFLSTNKVSRCWYTDVTWGFEWGEYF
jgi:hypothetical protein